VNNACTPRVWASAGQPSREQHGGHGRQQPPCVGTPRPASTHVSPLVPVAWLGTVTPSGLRARGGKRITQRMEWAGLVPGGGEGVLKGGLQVSASAGGAALYTRLSSWRSALHKWKKSFPGNKKSKQTGEVMGKCLCCSWLPCSSQNQRFTSTLKCSAGIKRRHT